MLKLLDERLRIGTVTTLSPSKHDLGIKYSNQLKRVYEMVTDGTLGIKPKIDVTNNSVYIRFSMVRPK